MKRQLNGEEFRLLCRSLEELGMIKIRSRLKQESTYINGITFYRSSDSPEGKIITFAEDDLKDDKGNTYIFDYPYYEVFGELTPGKRMIGIYSGDDYYVIPVDGNTFTLVGAVNATSSLDLSKAKKLPTPIVLKLPKEDARQVNDMDTAGIKDAIKKSGKFTAGSIAGSIALSLLSLIVIGLIWIFIVASIADDMSKTVFAVITAVAVVLFIFCVCMSIKFFKNIYIRDVQKMNYIKQIMIVGIEKEKITNSNLSYVSFYEWVGDELRFTRLHVGFAQMLLIKDAKYGDIAYMLTKDKYNEANVFTTRMFATKEMVENNRF
ncbi:MAG: hypothetical protein J6M24_05900 [Lachnospiraceae bacterium]|nr:hypothetical protein [Lachnospiraceae bacterium]